MKFILLLGIVLPTLAYSSGIETIRERLDYHELSAEQVDKAFTQYQYIRLSPYGEKAQFELDQKPWAGYWYPINNIEALIGKSSPLENLEKVLKRFNRNNYVLKYENNELSQIYADSWEGYCHAWAMASAIFPEPKREIKVKRRTLSISDIKGIMTKMVEGTEYDMVGIRYYGDFHTDGTYQDLRPEAVHAVLTRTLSTNTPVLIDDDAGTEVWTKPVFSFDFVSKPDPENRNALLVNAYIGVVKQREYVSDELTTNDDITYIPLEYRLYLGRTINGRALVLGGEWIGNSIYAHPDLIMVPQKNKMKSYNQTINNNLELIKDFIQTSY